MVVAISLLMVVLAAVGLEMGSALRLSRNNRNRSIAANLASAEMDIVRSTDFGALPIGRTTSNPVVDGTGYTLIRDSVWVPQDTTTGPCDAATGAKPAFLRVDVAITWADMAGTKQVESQTVLTPPVGTYDRYTGNIGVKVKDSRDLPAGGHLVTATGTGYSSSQVTSGDGCAFFAFLPAGTYTLSLATTGYVDGQGNATPSKTVAVGVGGTIKATFEYERAATAVLTLSGTDNGTVPPAVPVSLANNGFTSSVKTFAGSGSPRTLANLYPYTSGYQYFAGSCADADPEGRKPDGSAIYPGAGRLPPFSVSGGATATGSLQLPSVDVQVNDSAGAGVAGAVVTAEHAPDSRCGGGERLPAGSTDSSGKIRVSLPFGTWTFSATKGVLNGSSSPGTSLSPLVAGTDPATVVIK